MTITVESKATTQTAYFRAPEQMTIANAAVLYLELDEALGDAESIVFDLAATERIDTSGVQLLLAAGRQAHHQRIEVRWEDPHQRLESAIATLGLSAAFAHAVGSGPEGFASDQPGEE